MHPTKLLAIHKYWKITLLKIREWQKYNFCTLLCILLHIHKSANDKNRLWLSIYPLKKQKTLFKGLLGHCRAEKKGHHRTLRQKLKKRHLVLSLKNVILVLKTGKNIFLKKVRIQTTFLALKRTYYGSH